MNEPTVLDYVKAKLKFWEKTDLQFPSADAGAQPLAGAGASGGGYADAAPDASSQPYLEGQVDAKQRVDVEALPAKREAVAFPWLVVLPVGAALIAQFFLEPPARYSIPALIFYFLAGALTVLAFVRGQLSPAERDEVSAEIDDRPFYFAQAILGVAFALLALLLFGGNQFNLLNVTLWLISIGLFLSAFLRRDQLPDFAGRLRSAWNGLRRPGYEVTVRISRWSLLLLAALALIAFFRFYRLDTLPVDMISDHAEKLLDVNDLLNGHTWIFFERNTGREPLQFYWTAAVIKLFGLDVSFFSLKLGTVLAGLVVLYYTYRLGRLIGNRWVALFALLFTGVSYWANVISRIALRFPFYPLFVAPLLFHLIRALRTGSRNDFIWAGIWLGIGLNGYTSSRIVPFLVIVAVLLYVLHRQSEGVRSQAWTGLVIVAMMAFLICLPLMRYGLEHPQAVMYRSLTRLGEQERPLPGPPLQIFLGNFWAAVTMFFYDNGSIWVHSVPGRPALDLTMAALFFVGVVLLLARYVKERHWEDLFLLVSIPILLMPSILSLAFPGENPSLNRTAGAYVPVLVIAALGLEAMLRGLAQRLPAPGGRTLATVAGLALLLWTVMNNYNLFFVQYANNYRQSAWNTREVGAVAGDFIELAGTAETYYVVGFPHWLDSRQVAIFAGHIERDPAILPDALPETVSDPRMKMFIVKPEDSASLETLRRLYPHGRVQFRASEQPMKDFLLFLVPAGAEALP